MCTNLKPFQHGEGCKILPQLHTSANTGLAQTIFETISSILQPPFSSPKESVLASDTRVQNLTRAYCFLPMENQAASDKEAVLMLFVKRIMKGNDAKRHATGLPAALAPWIQSNKMQNRTVQNLLRAILAATREY